MNNTKNICNSIITFSPDSIIITDLEGCIIITSPSVSQTFGYPEDTDFTGHLIFDYLDAAYLKTGKKLFAEMEVNKTRKYNEFKGIKSDGSSFDIEVIANIITDAKGEPSNLTLTIKDITDRKKTENKLIFQTRLQDLLINISNTYINLPAGKFEDEVNKSLAELGQFADADRFYIFEYNFENLTATNTHEWCAEGIEPQIEYLKDYPVDLMPDWIDAHLANRSLFIPDIFSLPKDSAVRIALEPQGIKSILTVPLTDGDKCLGFIGFDSVKTHYEYSAEEEKLLRVFAQMIVNYKTRIQTENTLKSSEHKYKVMFNESPDGYLIIDEGVFIDCNPVIETLTGLKKSKLIGKTPAQISPEYQPNGEKSDEYAKKLLNETREKEKNTFEFVHLKADGSEFTVLVNLTIIDYEGKKVIFTSWRDITERKFHENEFRKFKTISDQANYGSAITNMNGYISYVNKAFANMHGYQPEELYGRKLDVFHTEQQLIRVNELLNVIKTKGGFTAEEVWHVRKDGTIFPALTFVMLSLTITFNSFLPRCWRKACAP